MTSHSTLAVDDVPPGTAKSFAVAGRRIVIVNADSELSATDELCPHLAVRLSRGRIDAACITCAGHGSVFRLADGGVVKWMGRKPDFVSPLLSGKPTPLVMLPVDVRDGVICVEF